MKNLEIIRRLPSFSGLDESQLNKLTEIMVQTQAASGEEIFAEGDEAVGFYGIIEGRVKIYKLSPSGKEQILHVYGPGSLFAEVPVFAGTSYPAFAAALEDARLVFIPRAEFRRLIAGDPDLAMSMLALLSMRLRDFTRKIEALSLKEVPERLAAHLLLLRRQSEKETFRLDLPKGQLASLLGTIPETLSRVLKRLGKSGYIEVNGSEVTILDEDGLMGVASGESRA